MSPRAHLTRKTQAFAIRDAYCTDSRRVTIPPDLLAPHHLARFPLHEGLMIEPRAGGGDTSSLVAIDAEGQAVSWVQSLFDEFGSGVVCADQGIVLHNRAALERLDDDPVHGLKGGYRPFHTLCPALVTGLDCEVTAIASPGDHGQPQTLAVHPRARSRRCSGSSAPRSTSRSAGSKPRGSSTVAAATCRSSGVSSSSRTRANATATSNLARARRPRARLLFRGPDNAHRILDRNHGLCRASARQYGENVRGRERDPGRHQNRRRTARSAVIVCMVWRHRATS